jgi:hypothetical protein
MLNSNGKSSKIYLNQQLYLGIKNFLNDFDFFDGAFQINSPKKVNRLKNNKDKEQIQKNSKSFLLSIKNDSGMFYLYSCFWIK